eukprot:709889-Prymnesium_polylepis.1
MSSPRTAEILMESSLGGAHRQPQMLPSFCYSECWRPPTRCVDTPSSTLTLLSRARTNPNMSPSRGERSCYVHAASSRCALTCYRHAASSRSPPGLLSQAWSTNDARDDDGSCTSRGTRHVLVLPATSPPAPLAPPPPSPPPPSPPPPSVRLLASADAGSVRWIHAFSTFLEEGTLHLRPRLSLRARSPPVTRPHLPVRAHLPLHPHPHAPPARSPPRAKVCATDDCNRERA